MVAIVGNELSETQPLNTIDTFNQETGLDCGDRFYELTVSPSLPNDVLYIDGTSGDITIQTSEMTLVGSYTVTVRASL